MINVLQQHSYGRENRLTLRGKSNTEKKHSMNHTRGSMNGMELQSFIRGFGISVQNILQPLNYPFKHKDRHDHTPKLSHITLDNINKYIKIHNSDIQDTNSDLHNDKSTIEASLTSMLKGELVSRQDEIEDSLARNNAVVWLTNTYRRARVSSEVLHLAVSLVDGFLSSKIIPQEDYEKLSLTCLWMSAKFQHSRKYCLRSFIELCQHSYSTEDIISMEEEILGRCNFNLCVSTSLDFLRTISSMAMIQERTSTLARYLLELGLLEYRYLNFKKSLLALSALYVSCRIFEPQKEGLIGRITSSIEKVRVVSQMFLRSLTSSSRLEAQPPNSKGFGGYLLRISWIELMELGHEHVCEQ